MSLDLPPDQKLTFIGVGGISQYCGIKEWTTYMYKTIYHQEVKYEKSAHLLQFWRYAH